MGWLLKLFGMGKSAQGALEFLPLLTLVQDLGESSDEAAVVFKEAKDFALALIEVLDDLKSGAYPSKANINRLQGERVQFDMALGAFIASLPTGKKKNPVAPPEA